jgi:hypothetical protein
MLREAVANGVITKPGQVRLDSPRLISDLAEKLTSAFAMPESPKESLVSGAAPLAHGGLEALRARPGLGEKGPLPLGGEYQAAARSVLGLAGYIVIQYRPDGALAYSAIAQQIAPNFTDEVWRATLQLGKYLVATKHLALTFRGTGRDMAAYADSSALNAEGGRSWGGYGLGRQGSGLTHYRVLSPKQLADSSGGNELIIATMALKEVIAERISQAELGTLPDRATELHLDAQVVLDGVAMDRVSRESRYLAAKLSMLREAVANGVIQLEKIPTALNPADIFTKPLVGAGLKSARALVLGTDAHASVLWMTHPRVARGIRMKRAAVKKATAKAMAAEATVAASAPKPPKPSQARTGAAAAKASPDRATGAAAAPKQGKARTAAAAAKAPAGGATGAAAAPEPPKPGKVRTAKKGRKVKPV